MKPLFTLEMVYDGPTLVLMATPLNEAGCAAGEAATVPLYWRQAGLLALAGVPVRETTGQITAFINPKNNNHEIIERKG